MDMDKSNVKKIILSKEVLLTLKRMDLDNFSKEISFTKESFKMTFQREKVKCLLMLVIKCACILEALRTDLNMMTKVSKLALISKIIMANKSF